MKLSILICTLSERQQSFSRLKNVLRPQLRELEIEICVEGDNRQTSTGLKRQKLLDRAQGDFITFIDDDDLVSPKYIETILPAIEKNPDVICFNSLSKLNDGNPFTVRTSLAFENQQCFQIAGKWQPITRKPWHWCVWKRSIAVQGKFPDAYIDDDWYWLRQVIPLAKTEVCLDEILHFYQYS